MGKNANTVAGKLAAIRRTDGDLVRQRFKWTDENKQKARTPLHAATSKAPSSA